MWWENKSSCKTFNCVVSSPSCVARVVPNWKSKWCNTKYRNETETTVWHICRICWITLHYSRTLPHLNTTHSIMGWQYQYFSYVSVRYWNSRSRGQPGKKKEKLWMGQSQREQDRVSTGETTVPLPAAKVAETRLLQGISIPHHDRKSLPQTEPIKIWAWIKISKACQMASPHHRGLNAVDAPREGMKSA